MQFVEQVSVAPLWLWAAFSVGIFILLLIDLALFGRKGHVPSRRVAILESALWVSVALIFNAWFWSAYGSKLGLEFLTGYLVEKSLSIDNLFVILLVFKSLKVPATSQHRVLFYGVLGAIILRAIFILIGAQLLHHFHWILYIFGFILVVTAINFIRGTDKEIDTQSHWSIRLLKKIIPISQNYKKENFFIKESGITMATPLFVALIIVEATDVIFAVDSIPAVFAVTQDAFVAYSSNILAVLGLRALYFVLADGVSRLRYLKPGLAAVLGFIGIKMLIVDLVKIPSWVSLLTIIGILTTAGLSSWYVGRVEKLNKNQQDLLS